MIGWLAGLVLAAQFMTFAGVTLGESGSQLVADMGEPVARSADGTTYLYVGPGSSREVVHLTQGTVREVELDAFQNVDPRDAAGPALLGVTLRDPESKLDALGTSSLLGDRRVGDTRLRAYRLDASTSVAFVTSSNGNGIVSMLMTLKDGVAPTNADAPPILHSGTSFDDAIVLKAANESIGVTSEYAWLAEHPCTGGNWKVATQALVNHGAPYDVLSAKCTKDAVTRDFYLNIAGFFGKT